MLKNTMTETPDLFLTTPIVFKYPQKAPYILIAEDREGNKYEIDYEVRKGYINPYKYTVRKLEKDVLEH